MPFDKDGNWIPPGGEWAKSKRQQEDERPKSQPAFDPFFTSIFEQPPATTPSERLSLGRGPLDANALTSDDHDKIDSARNVATLPKPKTTQLIDPTKPLSLTNTMGQPTPSEILSLGRGPIDSSSLTKEDLDRIARSKLPPSEIRAPRATDTFPEPRKMYIPGLYELNQWLMSSRAPDLPMRTAASMVDTLTFDQAKKTMEKAPEFVRAPFEGALRPAETTIEKVADVTGQAAGLLAGGEALGALRLPAHLSRLFPALNTTRTSSGALRATLPAATKSALDKIGSTAARAAIFGLGGEYVQGAITPNMENRSLVAEFGASMTAGSGDVVEGMGQAAKWLGFDSLSNDLILRGQRIKNGFEIPMEEFSWKSLLNPRFYAVTAGRALPFTIAMLPLALVGGATGGAVAGVLGMGALRRIVMQSIGASILATPFEAAVEAGQVYEEARERGWTEEEANKAANQTFLYNAALLGFTNSLEFMTAFMPKGLSRLINRTGLDTPAARILGAATIEGAQEGTQEIISDVALGDDIDLTSPELWEQAYVGALMGAGFGVLGSASTIIEEQSVVNLYNSVKSSLPVQVQGELDRMVQQGMIEGKNEVEAVTEVLEVMAQQPEGEQIISETINKEIADFQEAKEQQEIAQQPLPPQEEVVSPQQETIQDSEQPAQTETHPSAEPQITPRETRKAEVTEKEETPVSSKGKRIEYKVNKRYISVKYNGKEYRFRHNNGYVTIRGSELSVADIQDMFGANITDEMPINDFIRELDQANERPEPILRGDTVTWTNNQGETMTGEVRGVDVLGNAHIVPEGRVIPNVRVPVDQVTKITETTSKAEETKDVPAVEETKSEETEETRQDPEINVPDNVVVVRTSDVRNPDQSEYTVSVNDVDGSVRVVPVGGGKYQATYRPSADADAIQSDAVELNEAVKWAQDILNDSKRSEPDIIEEKIQGSESHEDRGTSEGTDGVRTASETTLEGTPTEDVQGTGEVGETETSAVQRTGTDERSDDGSTRTGDRPSHSVGDDAGDVVVLAGRGDSAEVSGESGGLGVDTDVSRGRGLNSQGSNYVITDSDDLGLRGKKTSYKDNVRAIRLMKEIMSEGREATAEEQKELVKYVGWGGIAEPFNPSFRVPENWKKEHAELKELLTEDEWQKAADTILNAHYTSKEVIQSMYDGLRHFGFENGRVLEPSMGVGHFIGLVPQDLHAQFTGVEIDPITGNIAKLLYPRSDVRVMGFEETKMADNFYDVAIGNVPFGNYGISDSRYRGTGMTGSIHNYFFAKALDKVRPGGLVMFLTSRYTMDAVDPKVRRYISSKADLVGAVRLPNTAFKKSAGTEVVTDILILKKRDEGTLASDTSWVDTGRIQVGDRYFDVNQYYIDNPNMVMGKFSSEGTMYRGGDLTVSPSRGNLQEAVSNALMSLPENIISKPEKRSTEDAEPRELIPAPGYVKENAFVLQNDIVYRKENDVLIPTELKGKQLDRVKGMMKVRDAVRDYLRKQLEDTPENLLTASRNNLNKVYDDFVKKHGYLSDQANYRLFQDDPDSYLLLSLENYDKENKTATKADIFTKRTIQKYIAATKADTAKEALIISLGEKGYVDLARMAELTSKSTSEIIEELKGHIFNDPQKGWVTEDEYLSGNVKEKLVAAQNAAELDPSFQENVEALLEVQPVDLSKEEIDVKLGAHWIPTEHVQSFAGYLVGETPNAFNIGYNNQLAEWTVDFNHKFTRDRIWRSTEATVKWGTNDYNAIELLEMALNMKTPTVRRTRQNPDGSKSSYVDQQATVAVREKQNQIKDEFAKWIWTDEQRAESLVRLYNDRFNTDRLRNFNGDHLILPGMNPSITLKKHQMNAVWRAMQKGNTLFAHAVGAGKTFEMIASMMELKRTGVINKPMWVVPNHLVEQMAADFMKLYPAANILVAGKKDFEKNNRRRLFARISTGSYDAVIIPHSSFSRISMSKEVVEQFYQEQLMELELAMEQAVKSGERKESGIAKRIRQARKSLEARMNNQLKAIEKDDNITFEELGVDSLIVDEAHEFKNLFYATKLNRVAGLGNPEGSAKAFDLFMKVRYLQRLNGGRGVIFATGTPVSNSLAEMYTFQRYLQYDEMKKRGILSFDSWVSQFGEVKNVLELSPEGKGLRMRTRLNEIVNLPELLHMFRDFADVKTADELLKEGLITRPELKEGKRIPITIPATEALKSFVQGLADRAEAIRSGRVKPDEDNMLSVVGDGRKAALDMRLVDPDSEYNPNSKVNIASDNIVEIYKRSKKEIQKNKTVVENGTQLVFLDLSTPKAVKVDKDGREIVDSETSADDISIYNELRRSLVKKGIPQKEIAFIHDYPTDAKKEELFYKVNKGEIRVLIGSTAKMGAGMNVQTRLKALHHLDVPWRPSDIEQREGRILRQGNLYDEVEVYAYMTEESFDAYMWQTIANKAKVVDQTMSGDLTTRRVTDPSGMEMSANELKALATGDPRILELANLEREIAEIDLKNQSNIDTLKDVRHEISYAPSVIKSKKDLLEKLLKDQKQRKDTRGDRFVIEIQGERITERKVAGAKLMELENSLRLKQGETKAIGSFAGFPLEATSVLNQITRQSDTALYLKGALEYSLHISDTELGTMRSIENTVNRIDERILETQEDIERLESETEKKQSEVKRLESEVERYSSEYNEKLQRKVELEQEMNLDERESVSEGDESFAFPSETSDRKETITSSAINVNAVTGLSPLVAKRVAKIIAKHLGTPIRQLTENVRAEGTFSRQTMAGSVRRRSAFEWRVLGHELGHAFNFTYGTKGVKSELRNLAQQTYPGKLPKGREVEEGFAEFFFIWVADPDKARQWTPLTTEMFESFISENRDLSAMMGKVRVIVDNHLGGTPIEKGLGSIVSRVDASKEVAGEYSVPLINRGVFNFVDSTLPAGAMMKDVNNPTLVDLRKILSTVGGAKSKAVMSFTSKATDFKGSHIDAPVLQETFEKAVDIIGDIIGWKEVKIKSIGKKLGALEIFSLIGLSNRVIERHNRGYEELPLTRKEAESILEQAKKWFPKEVFELSETYAEALSDIILEKLVSAGVITEQAKENVKKGSTHYYPFFYDDNGFFPVSGKSEQGRTNRNPVKRFRGKRAAVLNLFQATLMKLTEVEQAVEYKRSLEALHTAIEQKGMGKYGVIIPAPPKVVNVDTKQIMDSIFDLLDSGIDVDEFGMSERILRIFMPGGFDTIKATNVVMNVRDGKPTFMQLAPDVFKMMMAMRPVQINGFIKSMAWFTRISRYTFLATPTYVKGALTRDLADSLIQSRNNPAALMTHYHQGLTAALGLNQDVYRAYVNSGGRNGSYENVLRSMTQSNYDEGILKLGSSGWGTVQMGFKKMLARTVRTPGEILRILEEYPRIAEFMATWKSEVKKLGFDGNEMWDLYKEKGTEALPQKIQDNMERILVEASYNSHEVISNFGVRGVSETSRKYMLTVPLMAGSVKGVYRAMQTVKNHPLRAVTGMTMISLISIASWVLMNLDDDNKKHLAEMNSRSRDRYWWFELYPGSRIYVGLSKSYEYNLAANMLERYLDHLYANVPNARKPLEDWKTAIADSFSIPWIPLLAETWVELQSNTNSFGGAIVPQAEQYTAKDMQFGPGTSEAAKGIAAVINQAARLYAGLTGASKFSENVKDPTKGVSARQVEYFINAMTGQYGSSVLGAIDWTTAKMMGKSTKRIAGIEYAPVVGGIFYSSAEGSSRIVNKFYDDYRKAQTLSQSVGKLMKQENVKLPAFASEENAKLIRYLPAMRAISEELSTMRKEYDILKVEADAEQKRKLIMQQDYAQKLATGLLYGVEPASPNKDSGITEEQIQMLVDRFTSVAQKALVNEQKSKGGPTEQAVYLLQLLNKK